MLVPLKLNRLVRIQVQTRQHNRKYSCDEGRYKYHEDVVQEKQSQHDCYRLVGANAIQGQSVGGQGNCHQILHYPYPASNRI
jgi:hypothetical protein